MVPLDRATATFRRLLIITIYVKKTYQFTAVCKDDVMISVF